MKQLPLFVLSTLGAFLVAVSAPAVEAPRDFEKLEHCRLMPNESNDGDSFHVKAKGKEFIFRLYFTDTPETEAQFPERVQEQAAYFGIKPEQAIRLGKIAAEFTHGKLGPKEFTVFTRWQDARGESRLPRYYAFVMLDNVTLEELLVGNGLARVFGQPAILPNGTKAATFAAHLRTLEAKAKSQRLGGWSRAAAPVQTTDSWAKMFPGRAAPSPATGRPSY
ncbi:MAG: hypothetical protein QOD99_2412 [Chthoniobacter sp.]|jgi:endonuclease YncB( thermonuclease family)|nr:hypothetical protein [Chthoniobacter sp.]